MAHGHFVWHDLATRDPDAAMRFYLEVLPWSLSSTHETSNGSYPILNDGHKDLGGIMRMDDANWAGVPAHWSHYIEVDDLDSALASVSEHGGTVSLGPVPIPHVGRFARVADPLGAAAYLIQLDSSSPAPGGRPKTGEFCWQTLVTSDLAASSRFWSGVVGWTFETMDVHGGFTPTIVKAGEAMVADVEVHADQPSRWDGHVAVDDVEKTHAQALAAGASTRVAPMDVGQMGRMVVVTDPTGAPISFFQSLQ